jgi:hypothetical protein
VEKWCLSLLLVTGCGQPVNRRFNALPPSVIAQADAVETFNAEYAAACGNRPIRRAPTKTMSIPATSYGEFTGVYVRQGDLVSVRATGDWTYWQGQSDSFSAEGVPEIERYAGCVRGSLAAAVGLTAGGEILCLGSNGTARVQSEGLLYLAMNDPSSPLIRGGALTVELETTGQAAPEIAVANLATADVCQAPWLELTSQGSLTLQLPAAVLKRDQASAARALAELDGVYAKLAELAAGAKPYGGSRLRLIPDDSIRPNWLLAGNPLRYDTRNLDKTDPSRAAILKTGQTGYSSWDFAKGFGHAFSRTLGTRFHADLETSQAWSTVFGIYAMEAKGETDSRMPNCTNIAGPRAIPANHGMTSVELKTCMLVELEQGLGWTSFISFYREIAGIQNWDLVLAEDAAKQTKWQWFVEQLGTLSNQDTSGTLAKYSPYLN